MTKDELNNELKKLQMLLDGYEELDCDMENPEYVARGNGFCDAKYSEDFIEGQIASIRERMEKIKKQLESL